MPPSASAVAATTTAPALSATAAVVPPTAAAPARTTAAQSGAGTVAGSDPCTLWTKQEVAAALAEPVDDGKPFSAGAQMILPGVTATVSNCEYSAAASSHSASVDVWRFPTSAASQAKQFMDIICRQKERVTGIGDYACWYSSDHDELQLSKGSTYLDIKVNLGFNKVDATEPIKTLAKHAIDRLR
jgi:hypothetical protein